MEALQKKRRMLKSKCTRLKHLVDKKIEDRLITEEEVEIYEEQARALWTELSLLTSEISALQPDDEMENSEKEYDEISTKIENIKVAVLQIKKANLLSSRKCEAAINSSECVKLPRIELPTFSGHYMDWISFRDLFTSTIHNNKSLSNGQKLQYLKLGLKNEAALIIQNLQITDDNYDKAWTILSERYEDTSEIVTVTLDRLFNQPVLRCESSQGLRKLLDITNQCIATLEILKQPVSSWDTILIYILRAKLDEETLRQFTLSLEKGRLPTFKEFQTFIEKRASALSSLNQRNGPVNPLPLKNCGISNRFRSYPSHDSTLKCLCCGNPHHLQNCATFKNESVSSRINFLKQHQLCAKCLKIGHTTDECWSYKKSERCNEDNNEPLHDVKSHGKADWNSRKS